MKLRTKIASKPSAEFDAALGCLRICASAPVPDHDGEVIDPASIVLDHYRMNPVVLWSHKKELFPIARCESPAGEFKCWIDGDNRLMQEWYFADSPEAQSVARLYRQNVLRGASIGFKETGRVETLSPERAKAVFGYQGGKLRVLVGVTLLETSAVPIPSCPDALAEGWIDDGPAFADMGRLSEVLTRGVDYDGYKVPDLVLKSIADYGQATARVKVFSMDGTKTTTEKPGASAVSKSTKDMDTLDDTAGGSTVEETIEETTDPRDTVKAGLLAAMHDCIEKMTSGDLEPEAAFEAIKSYWEDHQKYSDVATDEIDTEDKETEAEMEEEDDAEAEKQVADIVARIVKLEAKSNEHDEALVEAVKTIRTITSR